MIDAAVNMRVPYLVSTCILINRLLTRLSPRHRPRKGNPVMRVDPWPCFLLKSRRETRACNFGTSSPHLRPVRQGSNRLHTRAFDVHIHTIDVSRRQL
jgi:hypothetical protein